jgi:hypothetical protein
MSNTVVKVTPKMLNALVSLFYNDLQDPKNFHRSVLAGLVTRGLAEITPNSGYAALSEEGEKWLVKNRYAAMSEDIRISASTTQMSYETIVEMTRRYHERKALEKFNTVDDELVGKPLIRKVYDKLNNVGRLCNIKNNNDTENRCWEIVTAFDYVDRPTGGALYVVRYVGKDRFKFRHTAPYFLTDINHVTNLY